MADSTSTPDDESTAERAEFPLDVVDGQRIVGLSPVDGQPLEVVTATSVGEIAGQIERARKAQIDWSARPIDERCEALLALRDAVLAKGDELVATLCKEGGKVEAEAWLADVLPTADVVEYWAYEGRHELLARDLELDPLSYPGKRGRTERVPRGVIGVISPWNLPVALPLRTIVPALLAGNAIVWKPSEHAARVSALLGAAIAATVPRDLVVLVQGGAAQGEAVVRGCDAIAFTGSVATGRKVAAMAAERLVPCGVELGGKDAAIVLEDADLDRAAEGIAWGAFFNAGQNCASIERVYVVEKVASQLTEKLVAVTKTLRPGKDVGALCTRRQRETVRKHVDGAVASGAEALPADAASGRGLFYPPRVLTRVPEDADVLRDETFGPVVPIVVVKDEAEAVRRANDSRYGLTASVWTKKLARGEAVAAKLEAGVVAINNHGFTGAVPAAPWSGVRESGYGVTNSPFALDLLTRPRFLLVDARRAKREMWWYPYTDGLVRVARAMATLRRRSGIVRKVRAFFSLLGGFVTRWKR
ncbi:MAG: aldehyde dehydrogenase family protein [Deltaproteobacteria bacterium]|nr:aldehyde dehydrogenase family protein [Deltaproteobacteria bacterium]